MANVTEPPAATCWTTGGEMEPCAPADGMIVYVRASSSAKLAEMVWLAWTSANV